MYNRENQVRQSGHFSSSGYFFTNILFAPSFGGREGGRWVRMGRLVAQYKETFSQNVSCVMSLFGNPGENANVNPFYCVNW
jgi:hypothetical protein